MTPKPPQYPLDQSACSETPAPVWRQDAVTRTLFTGWNESDIQHCLAAQELNLVVSELLIDFTARPQNLQDHKHDIHLRAVLLRRT